MKSVYSMYVTNDAVIFVFCLHIISKMHAVLLQFPKVNLFKILLSWLVVSIYIQLRQFTYKNSRAIFYNFYKKITMSFDHL